MGDFKGSAMMNQGQRLRYLKTGGVIAFVLLVLYFIAPRDGLSRGTSRRRRRLHETPD
jgi:guanosine-diphosphatase